MATLFSRKQGAQKPDVEFTLTPSGWTFDLADATLVELRYRLRGSTDFEVIELDVTDAPNKKVTLVLTEEVVDVVGEHQAHVRMVLDGEDYYFPQTGFDKFKITENF